ncbi:hypothetical protein D3C78_1237710 [compost metagenome]
MQVVGEAVQLFGGGVEVEQLLVAGLLFGEPGAGIADQLHQLALAAFQAGGQHLGVGLVAQVPAERREQAADLGQARRQRRAHLLAGDALQALQQLVQAVEAGRQHHELLVQPAQAAAAQAEVRVLEGAGVAQVL